MKNRFYLIVLLIAGFAVYLNAQDNKVTIKYLGNMGVLISSGNSKLIIDALHQDNPWEYPQPSKETVQNILTNKNEFEKVSLLLATHNHTDHFNAELTYTFLKNKGNKAFLTQQSIDDIKNIHKDFEKIKSSVILTDNSSDGIIISNKENIDVKSINLSHGNETQNTGYIVEVNGIKIFHTGDAEPKPENFSKYNLDKENIDVVVLPVWFIDEYELVKSFNAKKVIYIHVHPKELGKYDKYLSKGETLITNLNEEFIYVKE